MRERGLARWVAPVVALSLAGCSVTGRVSVLPTVDTRGDVGVEAKLTLGVGLTTMFDHHRAPAHTNTGVLILPVSVGGGMRAHGAGQSIFSVDGGLEYASVGSEVRDLGFRVGVLAAERLYYPNVSSSQGATLESALLWTLWKRGDHSFALGPVLDAAVVGENRAEGRFGAGITLDWYKLTEWTVR